MTANRQIAHRGVTLIEMMVVIGTLSILLGLCALTMQVLMRVGSNAQAHRTSTMAIGRLAEQFRADVHESTSAELRKPSALILQQGGGVTIDYEARPGQMIRVESTGGEPTHRETYELRRYDSMTFEKREDGPRRFLVLVIRQKDHPGTIDPTHPMEILALLGKDRPESSPSQKGEPR